MSESPLENVSKILQEGELAITCQTWLPGDADFRTRIAAVHQAHRWGVFRCNDGYARTCCRCQWRELPDGPTHAEHVADAVIRELPELTALRRCGRCRIPCLPDEYPAMSEASNELRPFCIRCTKLDRGRR